MYKTDHIVVYDQQVAGGVDGKFPVGHTDVLWRRRDSAMATSVR